MRFAVPMVQAIAVWLATVSGRQPTRGIGGPLVADFALRRPPAFQLAPSDPPGRSRIRARKQWDGPLPTPTASSARLELLSNQSRNEEGSS